MEGESRGILLYFNLFHTVSNLNTFLSHLHQVKLSSVKLLDEFPSDENLEIFRIDRKR